MQGPCSIGIALRIGQKNDGFLGLGTILWRGNIRDYDTGLVKIGWWMRWMI